MAVLRRLEVDRLSQIQLLDNDTGTQVEVVTDDLDQLSRSLLRSAVMVDVDGEGLGNTDGVRQLDEDTTAEASSHQRLGNPTSDVGSRAVNLREVLAREGAATQGAPTSVSVDDDLAASQTSVTLGATDDEQAGRLNLELWLAALYPHGTHQGGKENLRDKWSCHPSIEEE